MRRVRQVPERLLKLVQRLRSRPGLILGLALGGLLVTIAITGIAGLAINQNVADLTGRSLEYDFELEDEGDDMRVGVLDLRHYHRDVVFYGPDMPPVRRNFENAYLELHGQIDDYAVLDHTGAVMSADEMRALAEKYYGTFAPAISLYEEDRAAFDAISDNALAILQQMEEAARDIEQLGEERAGEELINIDRANAQAGVILLSVLGGLVVVGAGLVWATVRVVGQIRQLYTRQQAASAQLEEALQAKNDFIADASHELRTPLTVLRGNAEAGLAIENDCVHREILEEIVSESSRMTKLVEDLLFLARSDASSVPLRVESVAAEPLLLELAERAKVLVREQDVNLATALAGHGTIDVDVVRIQQAIMVLVDNAAKYSPAGGWVSLNSSSWRDEFIIEVADEGPGMPKEDLPLIFERFYRVDKVRSRRLGGAGLGLSIAKTIVEAHNGRIDVQSRLGEGTKMRIHLPLSKTRADQPSEESAPKLELVA